jgi:hypothetical protein
MALDPLFWDIVGLPENVELPLSFRAFGAWVCRGPAITESEIDEDDGSPATIASNVLSWANEQIALPMLTADLDAYLAFLQSAGKGFFASRVTMLCLLGRYADARTVCKAAIE